MRKLLFPIVILIIAATIFSSNGRAGRLLDCPAEYCSYLPLIGNPAPVVITEIYQWITRAGTYRFTGGVTANNPVNDVIIEVSFFDGGIKYSEPVILKASLPGQLNPFDIVTNVDYGTTPYEISVIDWKPESQRKFRTVTIVSVSYSKDTAGTLVTADLHNDETRPLLDIHGVIWGWDQIYGIEADHITDSLAPGETTTFSKYILGTHYIPYIHVSAQGILQP